MKLRYAAVTSLLLLPLIAAAQTFQSFLVNLLIVMSDIIIPFLIGIAFLIFVFNAVRFFVFEGSNKDGREKAKNLALYGVLAFVVIVIFWGVINMLAASIGLECDGVEARRVGSDYAWRDKIGPTPTICP